MRYLCPADIVKQVRREALCSGLRFAAAGYLRLAEKNAPPAFLVFEQRRILQRKAAVRERREVADGGFLDQGLRDGPTVAATPDPGIFEAAPLPLRAEKLVVVEVWGEQRRFATPVCEQFPRKSRGKSRRNPYSL